MKLFLLSSCLLFIASCNTNKAVYQAPDFMALTSRHKLIAILPVRLVQSGYSLKDKTVADIKAGSDDLGYVFQESLESYILKQTQKNKKGQTVSFQSTQKQMQF